MTINTTVSIILPTFNGGKYISNAIESVISQSFVEWELIVINDGSTDDTEEIVGGYVKKDNRIIYLKNEINLGIQKTLNRGLKEAKGIYIARIDDDDIWIDINKLIKQVNFLENNNGYLLVGTGVVLVDEKYKELTRYILPETDEKIRKKLLIKNCFTHSSVMFKKKEALSINGYSELNEVKHVEDYDLWLRIGLLGKFYNLPDYYTLFMVNSSSISAKNKKDQFKKDLILSRKYKYNYPNYIKAIMVGYLRFIIYDLLSKEQLYFIKKIIFKFYKEF